MDRIIYIICFIFAVSKINAQTFTVSVKVTDDGIPVNNATVFIKGTSYKFSTGKSGKVNFSSALIKQKNFKLSISDVRYAAFEKEFILETNNASKDSLIIQIALDPAMLVGPDIYSNPEIVYQSKKLNVLDFEFVGENLLLLTYEKRPGHNMRLVLAGEKTDELSSHVVNEDAQKLERDYEGRLHLVCTESVYQVTVYETQIYVLREDKEEYESILKPLVDKTDEHIYFSNYAWHYPAFSYYVFNTADSSYKALKYIEDKFMLDMYRAEYKYVDTRMKLEAFRMQERTGIDKEIWAAVWNGFPNSLYYKPVYAPMFVRNDSVMMFDHYANFIYYFDESNNLLDSSAINYHLGKDGKNWKKQLMIDDVTRKIYSVFEKNGTFILAEIDARGRITRNTNLDYKYPEKIKVHNGYMYFNYRPFESQQNKYLYKQPLN
ncbi:MAG TPA: hypothetical protein VK177_06135 [Flavobacteriales bacterium]|nr:hypothetical protein [Flavobacteriales bacterium]